MKRSKRQRRRCLINSRLRPKVRGLRPDSGRRLLCEKTGQATVEYLVVGLALIAVIVVLGLLATRLGEGLFVEHAAKSASHALTENGAGSLGDIILY